MTRALWFAAGLACMWASWFATGPGVVAAKEDRAVPMVAWLSLAFMLALAGVGLLAIGSPLEW